MITIVFCSRCPGPGGSFSWAARPVVLPKDGQQALLQCQASVNLHTGSMHCYDRMMRNDVCVCVCPHKERSSKNPSSQNELFHEKQYSLARNLCGISADACLDYDGV